MSDSAEEFRSVSLDYVSSYEFSVSGETLSFKSLSWDSYSSDDDSL